ncbi:hypothetical protein MYVA_1167 [Mycolicibacterium vaccae 95051]|nr:hypothetical protein MYVA_1167 [Mycolicibacterium vaccae 95051]
MRDAVLRRELGHGGATVPVDGLPGPNDGVLVEKKVGDAER